MKYETTFESNLVFSRQLSGPEVIRFKKSQYFDIKDDAQSILVRFNDLSLSEVQQQLHSLNCFFRSIWDTDKKFAIKGKLKERICIDGIMFTLSTYSFNNEDWRFDRNHTLER